MPAPELKKNIIIALFIFSVVLVLLNVIVNKYFPDEPEEESLVEITAEEASTRFRNAVLNYGFEEAWIASKKEQTKGIYSYLVKVPPDIPIALLIKEIRNSYTAAEAEIQVEEKKINGINYLKLISNGHLKLTSEFSYDKEILRTTGYAGTLILDAENLSGGDMDNLLQIPEMFGVVLMPSKNSAILAKKISGAGKEVIVILNDDIKDLEYKLGGGFSAGRIKDVTRTIVGSYPRAVFYLIDANSSIYNSAVKEQLLNEFAKRNIKIIPTNELIYFDPGAAGALDKAIARTGERKLIAVPADAYLMLNDEVERVRKIGFKFINPSSAVN